MNFKVQFNKHIHKLPSGIDSLDKLVFSIRQIFLKKLPEQYSFEYKDTDGDMVKLESEEDFQAALSFLSENNISSLKINVCKSQKPGLELYELDRDFSFMSKSTIVSLNSASSKIEQPIQSELKEEKKEIEQKQEILEVKENDIKNEQEEEKIILQSIPVKEEEAVKVNEQQEVQEIKEADKLISLNNNLQEPPSQSINQSEPLKIEKVEINQIQEKISNANIELKEEKGSQSDNQNRFWVNKQELIQLIEEVFEDKIKTLLANYNVIPKQAQIQPIEEDDNKNQQNSSQLKDKVKLKALLKSDPPSEVNSECGQQYKWGFRISNSGTTTWPKNTYFKCISGPNQNQKIVVGQVQPQQEYSIVLSLKSPVKEDKFPEMWSLVVESENQSSETFGPKVRYTLIVKNQNKQQQQQPQKISDQQKSSISISQSCTESKINNKIIETANKMKEILNGNLKQYVEFLQLENNSKLSADEAVIAYIEKQNLL